MGYFRDKAVLITGSNGGLGAEMARQLSAAGARVILHDLAEKAAESVPGALGYCQADLAATGGCEKLAKYCASASPSLDILINNAGIGMVGEFVNTPNEKWEKLLQVNLIAPMRLTKLLLPGMIARRSGHIVNISSVGGHLVLPTTTVYAVSKFALRAFGIGLRGEVKKHGIRVSNVYPFFTNTPILNSERFGYEKKKGTPGFIVDEVPATIRNALKGVERGDLDIFPSFQARTMGNIARLFPDATRLLMGLFLKVAD